MSRMPIGRFRIWVFATAMVAGIGPCLAAAPPVAQPPAGQPGKPDSAIAGLGQAGGLPLQVTSDQGIEWRQSESDYVARGNAIAKRGNVTLTADLLVAYYRKVKGSQSTEIWRVVADGHVRIATPTQTAAGDHAVYDLDQSVVILTGGGLKLTTVRDVVTARDSLEWYDQKQLAVARGNAVAIRGPRRVRGDYLMAQVEGGRGGKPAHISRIDAVGDVVIAAPDQSGTADKGVYDLGTGIADLTGHVTLTKGESTLSGDAGVIDLVNGVSRLLPHAASEGGPYAGRVGGYFVPTRHRDTGNGAASQDSVPPDAQNTHPAAPNALN